MEAGASQADDQCMRPLSVVLEELDAGILPGPPMIEPKAEDLLLQQLAVWDAELELPLSFTVRPERRRSGWIITCRVHTAQRSCVPRCY